MSAALVYEWRRITSIRATYVLAALFLLATAAVTFLIAQASAGVDFEGNAIEATAVPLGVVVVTGTNALSAIFLTTIAAQSFGHEYRYGLIRLTLSEFPRRWVIFTAKLAMVVAWIVALFVASVAVAVLVLAVSRTDTEPWSADVWNQIWRSGLFLVGYCAIAFALTLITRNLVLGVVIPLLMSAVVENLVVFGLAERAPWIADVLPFQAGNRFATGELGINMATGEAFTNPSFLASQPGLVYLVWVVVLVAASFVTLRSRDA